MESCSGLRVTNCHPHDDAARDCVHRARPEGAADPCTDDLAVVRNNDHRIGAHLGGRLLERLFNLLITNAAARGLRLDLSQLYMRARRWLPQYLDLRWVRRRVGGLAQILMRIDGNGLAAGH